MKKKRVILTGPELLTRSTIQWLGKIFDLKIVYHEANEIELSYLLQSLNPVDGLIHGGATFVSDFLFEKYPQIKWNIFPGMEPFPVYNRPALDHAEKHGIPIYPTGGGIRSVAKTTCQEISDALLIKKRADGRGIGVPFSILDSHQFDSLAVIGLGNIAKEILTSCPVIKKFNRVCYSGRSANAEFTEKTGIPFKPMGEAFLSDIIILAVAHIPGSTDGYIGGKLLQLVARYGVVINNVRPQIMNMPEVLEFAGTRPDVTIIIDASRNEILSEYGQETLGIIVTHPNIILTGHTAWKTSCTRKEYSMGVRRVVTENNLA